MVPPLRESSTPPPTRRNYLVRRQLLEAPAEHGGDDIKVLVASTGRSGCWIRVDGGLHCAMQGVFQGNSPPPSQWRRIPRFHVQSFSRRRNHIRWAEEAEPTSTTLSRMRADTPPSVAEKKSWLRR